RKNLLEYDEVMDEQRKRVYNYRQAILDGANGKQLIVDMIESQVDETLDQLLDRDYAAESFATWVGNQLGVEFDAKDFRGVDYEEADRLAKDEAERMAESQVLDAIDENLPDGEDASEWNWAALAKFVNTKWQLSVRDRDLKKLGREAVSTFLIDKAREAILRADLSDGAKFLEENYGVKSAVRWVRDKFGIELDEAEFSTIEPPEFKRRVLELAIAAYNEKEIEYPVMAGAYHFSKADSSGNRRYDREGLVSWARERFGVELSLEDVKNKQRDDLFDLLIEKSRENNVRADQALIEARQHVDAVFSGVTTEDAMVREFGDRDKLDAAVRWAEENFQAKLDHNILLDFNHKQLSDRFSMVVEDHFRPEMRRMERSLVLNILDGGWKDHLLAMDHLRSSVGLRGYAQVDPKVEYKREGMRTFEQMWNSIKSRVTDLIFRMEQLDEGFVGSTWVETEAKHQSAPSAAEMAAGEQSGADQSDKKPEPIRNREEKVGRNEPCPCGSGKKYKQCHGKRGGAAA
ncbi:MAG: SEC-C metal-binding domain-containing protein, partial [Pirellulales bacterium]